MQTTALPRFQMKSYILEIVNNAISKRFIMRLPQWFQEQLYGNVLSQVSVQGLKCH